MESTKSINQGNLSTSYNNGESACVVIMEPKLVQQIKNAKNQILDNATPLLTESFAQTAQVSVDVSAVYIKGQINNLSSDSVIGIGAVAAKKLARTGIEESMEQALPIVKEKTDRSIDDSARSIDSSCWIN